MYRIPQYRCALVRERARQLPHESVRHAGQAAEVFYVLLAALPHEEVHTLFLNASNAIVGTQRLAQGGLHGCAVTVADVFRGALIASASAIVLAHNHPSGDPEPSSEDRAMTRAIVEAGKRLNVPLVDHLVVCPERRLFRSVPTF